MSASDCAVGLLVDLSEPSPKVIRPKQKKARSKNRKKSTDKPDETSTHKNSETKENSNPTSVEGVRRNSFTISEAADISERILVDVTEKTSQSNYQSLWTLSDSNFTPLDDERFDFDLAGSPAYPVTQQEKAVDEEVFFGPVSFAEKCTAAALKSEVLPLSPLSSSQMAEVVKEAHTIANSIASMMSHSSSDSDRSNNSYASPIARWKAAKPPTNKAKSTDKTPKQSNGSPKSNDISSNKTDKNSPKGTPITTVIATPSPKSKRKVDKATPITTPSPKSKTKEDIAEGSGRRSSARVKRKSTFTIKDKEKTSFLRTPTQCLQFKDKEEPADDVVSESIPPHAESDLREVTTASTNLKDTENTQNNKKEVDNKKNPSRLKKYVGIPKPSGLKPPSSRMPVAANRSLHTSSSTESLTSVPCPVVGSRRDSIGSEGTADNLSIGSDISDISTASTASNISTSSRTGKLPTGRISGTGLPRISSKIDSGLGLKRMSYGGNASLNNTFKKNMGPMKATQPLPGLNRSLQIGSTKLNYSSANGLNSVKGTTPRQRMSLGPSPGGLLKDRTPGLLRDKTPGLLKDRTPRLGVVPEPSHRVTPALSSTKQPVPKRLTNGPLPKQSLIRPTDIHRKTLAANRSKQIPAVNGPLKATGQVSTRGKASSPKPHPAVKKTVECTPVKQNKSVQPKKLSLSTSFESPSRPTGHVAASTPRSTSKSANRRSFLPTPSKISQLVSVGSISASPLSFRAGSVSSVGSCGSSIRCDSDSVFDNSEQKIAGPGGDNNDYEP